MVKRQSKERFPERISPMLCTLVKEVPDSADYLYEIKWDGYRIIGYAKGGKVRLHSRSALNYTAKYPLVEQAIKALKRDVIFDGEVVVFNEEGRPDFDALQRYNGQKTPITYCVFDLLWLDGKSMMDKPLSERKEILQQLVKGNPNLKFSESFSDGPALYQKMLDTNMEGIVAKRKDSVYIEGERGYSWLKTPTRKRQEFVIGGWAESERGRSFRSLLFGAYEKGKLIWIGRSGGGYKEKDMPGILKKLKAIERGDSPFVNKVLDTKGAVMHWVDPKLVANFEFATWTKSGRIRKPATFLGFRLDKKPKQVVREVPKDTGKVEELVEKTENPRATKKQTSKKYLNSDSNWRHVDGSFEDTEVSDFPMESCTVQLHDIGRELWKGVAKGELILYYNKIAPSILPYIKDRPQSLNLKLAGAGGPTTFIKDMENRQPDCAEVFEDKRRNRKAGKRNQIDYLVCNNVETLLYMVDWGCVDVNPWAARMQTPQMPDYIWLDLDPTGSKKEEDTGFEKAITVAQATKSVLDSYKMKGFVKTSGKTGLHIYVPVADIDFDTSLQWGRFLADQVHELVADISTRSVSKNQRGNKVYIDADQNNYADTLAAPYCIRPYHKPTVSTPLDWKEVKSGLDRYSFNMETIEKRIAKKGDLFAKVLDHKIAKDNTKKMQLLL